VRCGARFAGSENRLLGTLRDRKKVPRPRDGDQIVNGISSAKSIGEKPSLKRLLRGFTPAGHLVSTSFISRFEAANLVGGKARRGKKAVTVSFPAELRDAAPSAGGICVFIATVKRAVERARQPAEINDELLHQNSGPEDLAALENPDRRSVLRQSMPVVLPVSLRPSSIVKRWSR